MIPSVSSFSLWMDLGDMIRSCEYSNNMVKNANGINRIDTSNVGGAIRGFLI